MKTTDKRNLGFERRPQSRNFIYFSEYKEDLGKTELQRFVVPWQMVETTKNKYVVE